MAYSPTVTFNGMVFNNDWWITDVLRPKPGFAVNSKRIEGADGSFYCGSSLDSAKVTVGLAPKSDKDIRTAFDTLLTKLNVSNPAKLQFSDEDGRYRLAVPTGEPSMLELLTYSTITLEFHCPHPALYGQTKTASVSTSSTSFTVGGTYPAKPIVASSNAVKSSSNLWGVRFDNKSYMRVPLESSSAVSVNINADTRVVKANGSTSMITLDSDWAELEPGTHTAYIDQGSGSATLSWVERWL